MLFWFWRVLLCVVVVSLLHHGQTKAYIEDSKPVKGFDSSTHIDVIYKMIVS